MICCVLACCKLLLYLFSRFSFDSDDEERHGFLGEGV